MDVSPLVQLYECHFMYVYLCMSLHVLDVSHGCMSWIYLIVVFMVVYHGCKACMYIMGVFHGCKSWMYLMDASHGCASWMYNMDVYHGCPPWMYIMNVYHGCIHECIS